MSQHSTKVVYELLAHPVNVKQVIHACFTHLLRDREDDLFFFFFCRRRDRSPPCFIIYQHESDAGGESAGMAEAAVAEISSSYATREYTYTFSLAYTQSVL